MRVKTGLAFPLIAVAVVGAVAIGCGCGGSDSAGGSSSSSGSSATPGYPSEAKISAEFRGKGPNGKLAAVGREADPAEREAVSDILEETLKARAAGDWAGQCSSLAASVIEAIEKAGAVLGAEDCASALEAQAAPVRRSLLANTMTGPIDLLRVQGSRGLAFYHGTKGKDYVMPVTEEGGEWKVAALTEEEVP